MKKIIIYLILITATFSCSVSSDDSLLNSQELLPIENVTIPEMFALGETYEIIVSYLRPTACHAFNDIYYVKYNNERTVAVISTVFNNNGNCTDLEDEELEASFNFTATEFGSYVFKFWKGLDNNGQDTYLVIEVPVM